MPIRFQVDGDFYDHPKSIGMSDAAVALWTRAGSYSAAKLTDGFIAEHVLATLSRAPEEAADELVRRGLWRRVKGGWRFHQWDHRNLTKARVEADREADKKRKRTARKPTGQNTNGQANGQIVHPESPPDSTRNPAGVRGASVSVSVSESVSGSGLRLDTASSPPAAPRQTPPTRCPEHLEDPDPPPCGRCADARRARNQWEADRGRAARDAPKCREHRGQPAHNCALCRAEQLAQPDEESP